MNEIALEKDKDRVKMLENEKTSILEKLSYINMYPKDKKYISLFPSENKKLDEKAEEMQKGIMESIRKQISAMKNKKYSFINQDTNKEKKSAKNDAFFLDSEQKEEETKIHRYIAFFIKNN